MSEFTKGKWKYLNKIYRVYAYNDNDNRSTDITGEMWSGNNKETHANGRLIAAAPELYELLREELVPTSDYGGILSFAREDKIRKLLARIDGTEAINE